MNLNSFAFFHALLSKSANALQIFTDTNSEHKISFKYDIRAVFSYLNSIKFTQHSCKFSEKYFLYSNVSNILSKEFSFDSLRKKFPGRFEVLAVKRKERKKVLNLIHYVCTPCVNINI